MPFAPHGSGAGPEALALPPAPEKEDRPMIPVQEIQVLRVSGPAFAVGFSPDGEVLAAGSGSATLPTLHLWQTATGKEVRRMPKFAGDMVTALAFSPRSDVLATASANEEAIVLWDTTTWEEVRRLPDPRETITGLAFSPDGKALAATGNTPAGNKVFLWNPSTGQKLRECGGDTRGFFRAVAFSPDGKTLAAAGGCLEGADPATTRREYPIFRWEADTGRELPRLAGHQAVIRSLAFARDGRTLASAANDDTIRLWDTATATERGHIGRVKVGCVLFTPDNRTLIGGGSEKVIRLWDAATGRERGRSEGHEGGVNALALTRDGTTLASAGQDQTVRLCALAGFVPLPEPITPRQDEFGPEVKGLRAKVSLAKAKCEVGESIPVRYAVRNVSKAEQTVWHSGFWPNHLVLVRDAGGKEAVPTEFGKRCRQAFAPGGERFKNAAVKVPPGGEDAAYEQYDLTKLFDLSKPGRYTVQYVYEEKQGGWEGRLPSNEAAFEVVAPKE
jgi:hypothetical protein